MNNFCKIIPARVSIFSILVGCALLAQAVNPLKIPGAEKTKVGIYIEDLRSGKVLSEHNSDVPFVPASVTKSLTTATAYCTFAPRGRFTTPICVNGKVKGGVLHGDVVISTVGDPTVESAHFPDNKGFADSIVVSLQRRGIKEIKGSVIIDESAFTDGTIPAGWLKEDIIETYGAGLYASNFRDNRVTLTLPSGTTNPHTPAVTVSSEGATGTGLSRKPDSTEFKYAGKKGLSRTVANPAPGSTMQAEVMRRIRDSGISISDSPLFPDKVRGEALYVHTSPTVEEILRSLMYRSDNMMAEGMLRSLAQGENRKTAIETERNFWLSKGFDVSDITLEDGSGLSRNNRITPRFLADVYKWMFRTDMARGYASLFPRAGVEGTMRGFLKGTSLEGRLATKTGSMRGVQCYGGYVLDESGQPTHVVVVMVNDFRCSRDRLKQEIGHHLLETLTSDLEQVSLK